jgi:hypothetical protein
MSFAEIVRRLAIEFPEDAIKAERVRNIYYRDKFGTEEPGTLFRRRQREREIELAEEEAKNG